jgi:hypothetical protein
MAHNLSSQQGVLFKLKVVTGTAYPKLELVE